MSLKKLTPVATCILIFLFSSSYTPAQNADWNKELTTANAARQRGEYTVAETHYKHVISAQERVLGSENLDVAASLNNLAVLYQDESMYTQAEPLYKRSLAIWKKHPGQETQVALCLNNLAALHHDENMYATAEAEYNSALAIWEKTHSAGSPDAAVTLAGLADIYHSQGRDTEAQPLYTRVLAIWEKYTAPRGNTRTLNHSLPKCCKLRNGNSDLTTSRLPAAQVGWHCSTIARANTIKQSPCIKSP